MGVFARTLLNRDVEVLDISMSGASVRSSRKFRMGGRYSFGIRHKDKEISVKGTIVWEKVSGIERVGEGETMPIYTAGIEFADDLSVSDSGLRDFISDHVELLKERRLSGVRVSLQFESGILSTMQTCVVRDISLGGIRIELDEEPSLDSALDIDLGLAEHLSPVRCRGRVVYFHEIPDETRKGYLTGIEFSGMSDADKARLESFISGLTG